MEKEKNLTNEFIKIVQQETLSKLTAVKFIKMAQQKTATAEALQQFPRILTELRKEAYNRIIYNCHAIKNYPETLKTYLTAKQWAKYQSGERCRRATLTLAHKKVLAEVLKSFINDVKQVNSIAAAEPITATSVTVDWHKSQTWGNNPTATTRTGQGYYVGRASGCGYDKESAALAKTFNAAPEVLKVLYVAEEKRLKAKYPTERREIIGYGSGYGTAPYFEGGVGVTSFYNIFKNCGYEMRNTASGARFDVYEITKAGK